SRNKEKAQASLNRFHDQKAKEAGVLESNPNLRPKYVQSVDSLPQAEKWRSTIISEISTRLTWIQDPDATDAELRELNDTINKLFNEKRAWEYHIKSLGGNDYLNFGKNLSSTGLLTNVDLSGATSRGYRYFGRAKELPDVKKLLETK
ncbi:Isy1-like splicing factor, partial [Suhomyces tanzawaensis NRRL Y-17324]